jgi:hypothetical protein
VSVREFSSPVGDYIGGFGDGRQIYGWFVQPWPQPALSALLMMEDQASHRQSRGGSSRRCRGKNMWQENAMHLECRVHRPLANHRADGSLPVQR